MIYAYFSIVKKWWCFDFWVSDSMVWFGLDAIRSGYGHCLPSYSKKHIFIWVRGQNIAAGISLDKTSSIQNFARVSESRSLTWAHSNMDWRTCFVRAFLTLYIYTIHIYINLDSVLVWSLLRSVSALCTHNCCY